MYKRSRKRSNRDSNDIKDRREAEKETQLGRPKGPKGKDRRSLQQAGRDGTKRGKGKTEMKAGGRGMPVGKERNRTR